MFRKVFVLLLILSSSSLSAQDTEDLLGSWTEIIGQHEISEKWSIPATVILEHFEVLDKFQFVLLRSGLTYSFSENFSASLGYDYFYSETFSGDNSNLQHKIWEQLSFKSNYSALKVSHRFRLESAWTKGEGEYALAHRTRYRLKLEHPLYKKVYITSFSEVFINLRKPYFNQNRIHAGLGYALDADLKIEIGYFKNHFRLAHFDRIRLGLVFNTRVFQRKINVGE